MPFFNHQQRQLYYETSGNGSTPLMLFNGLTMSTAAWTMLMPQLDNQYQVIRLDFQGQGLSDKTVQDTYALSAQADDAAALLDHLGVDRCYLAGLSYGGMVALHFARRHNKRLQRMLLASTLAWSDAANVHIAQSWDVADKAGGADLRFDVSLPWLFSSRFFAAQAAMLPDLRRIAATVDWAATQRILAGVRHHDARSWLADINIPTHIVVGDEDRLTPPYQARLLQQGIPGATLELLPGAGHAIHLEAADAFARAILHFGHAG